MTKEEKELLFIDLCARLPYYPYALFDLDKKFDGGFQAPIIGMVNKGNTGVIKYNQEFYAYGCMTPFSIDEFRIYLRPMSSMTESEKKEFESFGWRVDELDDNYPWVHIGQIENVLLGLNWLNVHYLDYRGLIPMNLALEASKDMYKIN